MDTRGESRQGIAEGTSSVIRLANSSATSFPGRNECPGTHGSLIVKKKREDSSSSLPEFEIKDGGEDKARVEEEKRNGTFVGDCPNRQ